MKKKDFVATLAMLACATSMGTAMIACGETEQTPPPTPGSYTVVFDTNGGTSVSEQGVTGGELALEPGAPTKPGYEFDGWYSDADLTQEWTFETDKVTGDLTLYAKWKEKGATADTYFDFALTGESYAIKAKLGQTLPADVILPSTHEGKAVTALAEGAFEGQAALRTVKLPASLTAINARAFRNCTNFEQLLGADNVTEIGANAFSGTKFDSSLQGEAYVGKVFYKYAGTMPANTEITLKAGTVSIAPSAFQDRKTLTKLTLNAELKAIGNYAFGGTADGAGITELVIPDGVETIGDNAFRNAKSLAKLTVGKGVKAIGANAFNGTALSDVTYKATDAALNETFKNLATEATLTVTDDVTAMSAGLVKDWTGLKTVVLGNGITAVPDNMFDGLANLKSVTLSGNVATIGSYAFRASGIEKIVIPESVTKIGTAAFADCASLADVEYNAVNAAGAPENGLAFKTCEALTKVTVGNKVTAIPAYLFMDVASLTTLTLGEKVQTIGDKAFYGTGISALTLPATLKTVGEGAFYGAKFASLELPAALETVAADAFAANTALTSVTLNSVALEFTGSDAMFKGCTELATLAVGAEVTVIPAQILKGNTKVASVTLGAKVTAVGDHAFDGCTALETVSGADTIQNVGTDAFKDTPWIAAKLEQDGMVLIGTTIYRWNGDLTVGGTVTTLTIPETVTAIAPNAFSGATNKNKITAIDFGENSNLESIGDEAFKSFSGVSVLNLPASVKSIGDSAFQSSGVATINFAENSKLETIGNKAFYMDNKLANVTFPDSLKSIGNYALYGAQGTITFGGNNDISLGDGLFTVETGNPNSQYVKNVTLVITAPVTKIPARMFDGHWALQSVTLPDTVLEVGDRAFYQCNNNFTEISLPAVKKIGQSSFENCSKLVTVTLNHDIESIGKYAFQNCNLMTGDLVFDKLVTVSERAFYNAKKITSVSFKVVKSIDNSAFYGCSGLTSVDLGTVLETVDTGFHGCTQLKEITLPVTIKDLSQSAFSNVQIVRFNGFANPEKVKLGSVTSSSAFDVNVVFLCPDADIAKFIADDGKWATNAGANWAQWKERFVAVSKYTKTEDGWTVVDGKIISYTGSKKEVTIPTAVTKLDSLMEIFLNADSLASCTSLTLAQGNTALKMVDGALMSIDGTILYGYFGEAKAISLADVTTVKEYAFYNKLIAPEDTAGFTGYEINMPKLNTVGIYAFYGCSGIKAFDFTKLSEIPDYAFAGTGITTLELSHGVIGSGAFSGCVDLTTVKLTAVTSLGSYAFQNCTELTSAGIAGTIDKLADYVFSGCSKLSTVTIPDTVTEIGRSVFRDCGLKSISLPSGLTKIGIDAFNGCKLNSITIPKKVVSIGTRAFQNCGALVTVEIPQDSMLETLDTDVFSGTAVLRLLIPAEVTKLNPDSLKSMNYIKVLDIASTEIKDRRSGAASFMSGSPLEKVVLRANKVVDMRVDANCFVGLKSGGGKIYVPDELVEAYKADSYWQILADYIVGISTLDGTEVQLPTEHSGWLINADGSAFKYIGDSKQIYIPKELTSMSDLGKLFGTSYAPHEGLTYTVDTENTAFKVENGVLMNMSGTVIYGYSSANEQTSFVCPATVTEIKPYAFFCAKNLTSVDLPNVVTIGDNAFGQVTLTSISIGSACTSIGVSAFSGNKAETVIIKAATPPTADTRFLGSASAVVGKIYVPAASVDAYKAATNWKTFASKIVEIPAETPEPTPADVAPEALPVDNKQA